MKVKNIIRNAAEYLNLKNVIKFLEGEIDTSEEVERDLHNLIIAVNMVNNTVASSYIELVTESDLDAKNDIIKFNEISSYSIIEIKKIVSGSGAHVPFKILTEGIKLPKPGSYKIEFTYFPEKLDIDDNLDYYLKLNELTFAMGVASEFLYIRGDVDDGYMWDKRFKNSLYNLLRPKRNIVMPARRW